MLRGGRERGFEEGGGSTDVDRKRNEGKMSRRKRKKGRDATSMDRTQKLELVEGK